MTVPKRMRRDSLTSLVGKVDSLPRGETPPDTVPSGFPSLDRLLGGVLGAVRGGLIAAILVLLAGCSATCRSRDPLRKLTLPAPW